MEISTGDTGLNGENIGKLSRKERKEARFKKILDGDPGLKDKLTETLCRLSAEQIPMPLVHFSSRAIITPDGRVIETGFVDNMRRTGFRVRDTNVAVMVNREENASIGIPGYFVNNPEAFVRDLFMKIKRYKHHGLRANKHVLAGLPDGSRGVPVALVINAANARLERATDFDDHILVNRLSGDDLLGQIDLEGKDFNRDEDLKEFVGDFVDIMDNMVG